jgi:ribosomal protein L37E
LAPFLAPPARQARCRFQTPTIARSLNAANGFERSAPHRGETRAVGPSLGVFTTPTASISRGGRGSFSSQRYACSRCGHAITSRVTAALFRHFTWNALFTISRTERFCAILSSASSTSSPSSLDFHMPAKESRPLPARGTYWSSRNGQEPTHGLYLARPRKLPETPTLKYRRVVRLSSALYN